jgi:hypothetical protein
LGNSYIPNAAYSSGTFSNGPVWASYAASALGVPLLPSAVAGGTNFAFGGATTGGPGPSPNLLVQASKTPEDSDFEISDSDIHAEDFEVPHVSFLDDHGDEQEHD